MEAICYTSEVLSGALDWINGRPSLTDEREVKEFINTLSKGFNRRFAVLHPLNPTPRTIPLGLKVPSITAMFGEEAAALVRGDHLKKPEPEEASRTVQTAQPQSLDSVVLINSISHLASSAGGQMTSSRAQMILYCVYGSYLVRNGARLDIEHPQVWKYGPVFPRAYKKGSLNDRGVCDEAYAELVEKDPEVASLVSDKTSALLYTPMADLNACHRSVQSPYGKTLRKNPDKWGTQIDDGLIADFFGHSGIQQNAR